MLVARKEANKILGFVSRNMNNKSQEVILKFYMTIVRPHLDYTV